jgi:hypothetical protein
LHQFVVGSLQLDEALLQDGCRNTKASRPVRVYREDLLAKGALQEERIEATLPAGTGAEIRSQKVRTRAFNLDAIRCHCSRTAQLLDA